MERPALTPVPGEAALLLEGGGPAGPTLLIADLHLGLGGADRWAAGPPEGSAGALAERLLEIRERTRARRLIVAGDVKHPIVGTPAPLRPVLFDFFSELLAGGIEVGVVLGNHDVGLAERLPREVTVHPSSGLVLDGVGIFHGHCWPSKKVLEQPRLVVGHLHPGFRFAPTASEGESKRRTWVRTTFEAPPTPKNGRARRRRFRARELIVLPPFHPLAGTEALNRSRPARGRSFLYGRFLAEGTSRIYLLDGTDLGPLKVPRRLRRTPASTPRAPGR